MNSVFKERQQRFKFLIPVLYSVAMALVVFYAWNEQYTIRKGGDSPLYRYLLQGPAYVRHGFETAGILQVPQDAIHKEAYLPATDYGKWVRYDSPSFLLDEQIAGLPRRTYLSPWGMKAEEFTILIPIEIDQKALDYLNGDMRTAGIMFAGIGENWEIFFNGKLVRAEMHLDETGQIRERRTWRDVYFTLDNSLFFLGTNILALHIVGDPSYSATGLFYRAPHFLDDYSVIETQKQNFPYIILCGIFGFTGIYYSLLFLAIRKKSEIYYLLFGIYSLLLCVYAFTRNSMVNVFIPDSQIATRLEYFSLILSIPVLCIFVEVILRRKVTKISWGYLGFCLFLAITQIFFSMQYGEDVIQIWDMSALLYFSYVVFYEIVYSCILGRNEKMGSIGSGRVSETSITTIIIGTIVVYFCGFFDVIDILFFRYSFNLFTYGTFVIQIGVTFALLDRSSGMYKQLEQSNIVLETAVHQRTLELEEQTKIALQASRTKSEFLATMSHEIRTPLNAVIGLSEIELRKELPDLSRDNITQILQSGSTLLGIIGDILDISKIEAGSFELVPLEYETASFLSDTINLNLVRLGSKHINFVLEIGSDFPAKLIGDELRVKQILNNLLSNAIKYTDKGTITLNVSWAPLESSRALIRFEVRDTGIGIRNEDMEKLFKSYTQLNTGTNRKIEGTGLGLTITKNLVEMMGGSITVESEYGKSSCFKAEIIQECNRLVDSTSLLAIGEETAKNLQKFRYATDRKEADFNDSWIPYSRYSAGGTVLVVDDILANLQVALGLLAPYGLQVDTAASGLEALEKVKAASLPYDMIFVDHMMPEMDGIETAAALRKIRSSEGTCSYAQTPIVVMTANALRGMREFYLEHGFDDYLSKPIIPKALDEIMVKWFPVKMKNEGKNRQAESFNLEIEGQRIDKLNHFRIAFESGRTIDKEYFEKFTAFLESLKSQDMYSKQEQISQLIEAAKNGDAQSVRDMLPAICETLQKQQEKEQVTEGETLNIILSRLRKALKAGETKTAGTILGEMGVLNLNPSERELYFLLYDLLLEEHTEKVLDVLYFWERLKK